MTWPISDDSASALLLEMEVLQGRTNTPDAIIKPGGTPEATALQPLMIPTVKAIEIPDSQRKPVKLTSAQRARILASLRRPTLVENRALLHADNEDETASLDFVQMNRNTILVSTTCWRATYNAGAGHLLIDAGSPSSATLITTAAAITIPE